MTRLTNSLQDWGTDDFSDTFKQEVEKLDCNSLPLDKALICGSAANAENLGVMVLGIQESANSIRVKAGIFFSSVIAGCNCADDPTPVDETNEYCELLFIIDKKDAGTQITVV